MTKNPKYNLRGVKTRKSKPTLGKKGRFPSKKGNLKRKLKGGGEKKSEEIRKIKGEFITFFTEYKKYVNLLLNTISENEKFVMTRKYFENVKEILKILDEHISPLTLPIINDLVVRKFIKQMIDTMGDGPIETLHQSLDAELSEIYVKYSKELSQEKKIQNFFQFITSMKLFIVRLNEQFAKMGDSGISNFFDDLAIYMNKSRKSNANEEDFFSGIIDFLIIFKENESFNFPTFFPLDKSENFKISYDIKRHLNTLHTNVINLILIAKKLNTINRKDQRKKKEKSHGKEHIVGEGHTGGDVHTGGEGHTGGGEQVNSKIFDYNKNLHQQYIGGLEKFLEYKGFNSLKLEEKSTDNQMQREKKSIFDKKKKVFLDICENSFFITYQRSFLKSKESCFKFQFNPFSLIIHQSIQRFNNDSKSNKKEDEYSLFDIEDIHKKPKGNYYVKFKDKGFTFKSTHTADKNFKDDAEKVYIILKYFKIFSDSFYDFKKFLGDDSVKKFFEDYNFGGDYILKEEWITRWITPRSDTHPGLREDIINIKDLTIIDPSLDAQERIFDLSTLFYQISNKDDTPPQKNKSEPKQSPKIVISGPMPDISSPNPEISGPMPDISSPKSGAFQPTNHPNTGLMTPNESMEGPNDNRSPPSETKTKPKTYEIGTILRAKKGYELGALEKMNLAQSRLGGFPVFKDVMKNDRFKVLDRKIAGKTTQCISGALETENDYEAHRVCLVKSHKDETNQGRKGYIVINEKFKEDNSEKAREGFEEDESEKAVEGTYPSPPPAFANTNSTPSPPPPPGFGGPNETIVRPGPSNLERIEKARQEAAEAMSVFDIATKRVLPEKILGETRTD